MVKIRKLLAIPCILLLASCTVTYKISYSPEVLDSYVGCKVEKIIEDLGEPSSEKIGERGSRTLIYDGRGKIFDYTDEYERRDYPIPQARFYIDPGGICLRTETSRTDPITRPTLLGVVLMTCVLMPNIPYVLACCFLYL